MKFFEIFKTGSYPQGAFTETDIDSLAKNYDPTFCEAPVTLDHSQTGPAYGWVSELKSEGDKLKASFKDISDDLKDFVQGGKYRKISVEIYRDLEGKKPYLKAVSFLGAAIPQVKGMEPITFKQAPSDTYIFEVSTTEEGNNNNTDSTLSGNKKDNGSENTSKESNNGITKFQEDLKSLQTQVLQFKETLKDTKYSSEFNRIQTQLKDLTDTVTQFREEAVAKQILEGELTKLKQEVRQKEFNTFLEEHIQKGNLTTAQKDLSLKLFQSFDQVSHFSNSSTTIDELKAFIQSLPKQVTFEEIATKDKQAKDQETVQFANASEESLTIYKQAKDLSQKENISFKDALLKLYK